MDLNSVGFGAIGGLFTGFAVNVLSAIGLKKRVDIMDRDKQDKSLCEERHKVVAGLERDVQYIRSRVDEINDHLRNQK